MSKPLASIAALALSMTTGCVSVDNAGSKTAAASAPTAASYPMVGGAAMYPTRTIVENAVNSKEHTTLVRAVQAAGLVDTLKGSGPFTVFAPTNAAFDKLPPGTVPTLLEPANKSLLTNVLTYHVVPGRKDMSDIMADIRAGGGTATYQTVAGKTVRARIEGRSIVLWDAKGNRSMVTQGDVMQSNGVIHVVDAVLLPA